MTTRGDFEDSDRHCPHDGKRMILEVERDDEDGLPHVSHHCLHCDYSEHDAVCAEHDGAWLSKSGTGGPPVTVGKIGPSWRHRRGYLGS
jgi:hypothetical protein